MRDTCLAFLMSIVLQDAEAMTRLIYRITTSQKRMEIRTLQNECAIILHRHLIHGGKLGEISVSHVLQDVSALIAAHQLKVPPEYALVIKAGLTLEGVVMFLDPKLDVIERARPYLQRVMTERFSPKDLSTALAKNFFDTTGIAQDAYTSLAQVLMDVEQGQLRINVSNPDVAKLRRSVDTLGLLIAISLTSAAFIIGAFVTLSPYDFSIYGVPIISITAILVAAGLLSGATVFLLLRDKVKKPSLAAIIKRFQKGSKKRGLKR